MIVVALFLFLLPVTFADAADAEERVEHIELRESGKEGQQREIEASMIEKVEQGEAVILVNDETAAKEQLYATRNTSSVTLTVGEEVYYEGWFTCYFYVNGNLAYCLEPLKNTPAGGVYTEQVFENPLLGKALYYLYGGPGYNQDLEQAFFGEYGGNVSMIYGLSHAVLSFIYDGEQMDGGALTGLSEYGRQKVRDITDAIRGMPEPAKAEIEIVPKERSAFYIGNGIQQTEVQTLKGDYRNQIQLSLKEHVTLHHGSTGAKETGTGTIRGGEEFYFTAPTEVTGNWGAKGLYGTLQENYSALIINKNSDTQVVGGWLYQSIGNRGMTELQIEWLKFIELKLKKVDAEQEDGKEQGAGSLKGAVYHVLDDKGNVADILTTNQLGEATSKQLPRKEYTIKEVTAPKGYLINSTPIKVNVTGKTSTKETILVDTKEEIIRGDVEIIKFGEDKKGEQTEIKKPLKGIEFTLTSKSTGARHTIKTDEDGRATTKQPGGKRGSLVYDTYLLEETKGKEGHKPIEPIEIQIKEEGKTLYYIAENKRIRAAICIQKKDQSTGKLIPIKGTEFKILDKEGEQIVMYTYYPKKQEHKTFQTEETGQLCLPEPLEAGVYQLVEVKAPAGYLLGKPVEFEVKEMHGLEEPLTVSYYDEPAKGKIQIRKIDEHTKETLKGVEFEVYAKEEVKTADGTVRIKKGELVEKLVTNEQGKSCSKELFLGVYEIKETKALEGYRKKEEPVCVTVEYEGQTVPVSEANITITNEKTAPKKVNVKTGDTTEIQIKAFLIMTITSALLGILLASRHFTRK